MSEAFKAIQIWFGTAIPLRLRRYRITRNFPAPHAIYLGLDSGYFGHQYQHFRCLSNRENHRIVVGTDHTLCDTAIQ